MYTCKNARVLYWWYTDIIITMLNNISAFIQQHPFNLEVFQFICGLKFLWWKKNSNATLREVHLDVKMEVVCNIINALNRGNSTGSLSPDQRPSVCRMNPQSWSVSEHNRSGSATSTWFIRHPFNNKILRHLRDVWNYQPCEHFRALPQGIWLPTTYLKGCDGDALDSKAAVVLTKAPNLLDPFGRPSFSPNMYYWMHASKRPPNN